MRRTTLVLSLMLVGCGDSVPTIDPPSWHMRGWPMDAGQDAPPGGSPDGAASAVPFQQGIAVTTSSGDVIGVKSGALRVFKGIPYAEAPVGSLRLRAPVPVKHWSGVFEARAFGPGCPQEPEMAAGTKTNEDCLSLNVWGHDDAKPDRPVMFWIHGGAFNLGSSALQMWDGADLARDGDVVVVSINYRLGALGFLALPELQAEDPHGRVGNLGIQDQVEALRWVKKNIRAFGGDPHNVTIFGESAGGISVCALLGAPAADGLYRRAISESGTGCNIFLHSDKKTAWGPAFDHSEKHLEKLGCADAEDRLACLRKLPVAAFTKLWSMGAMMGGSLDQVLSLWPVVDGVFLPKVPLERMRAGETPVVDAIFGSNEDEASLFSTTTTILTRADLRQRVLQMVGGDQTLADKVMAIYNVFDFPLPKDAYLTAMGDMMFNCGTLAAAKAMGHRGRVYYFQKAPVVLDLTLGKMHSVDVLYVFGSFSSMGVTPSILDLQVEKMVQKAWSSFARSGAPDFPIDWPSYDAGAPSVASIDASPSLVANYRGGRCDKLRALGLVP